MDNEHQKKDNSRRLYIPYGLNIEKEYFPGFGKKQLSQSAAGAVIFTVLSVLIFLFSNSIPFLIIIIIAGGVASVAITIKDAVIRISVLDQIINMIKFKREQQKFMYVHKHYDN